MPKDPLEPVRVLRTAAWMWAGYLAALACVDFFIYAGKPVSPLAWYYLINILPALVFLLAAHSAWIVSRTRQVIPAMILLISAVPVFLTHLVDLRLPQAPLSNIEGMIFRQLPVLLIGLVLVAWHYNLVTMVVFSICVNGFEALMATWRSALDPERALAFEYVVLIRTIAFIVVGIFINQLIARLRRQQAALETANDELAQYASTQEKLAISQERNRLARELHDTVAHALSGLAVQLETAKAYWEVEPETSRKLVDQSLVEARSGLDETRRALKALRASPLEDLGLLLALKKMAESGAERGRLALDLALPDQLPYLLPEVEQCLYRAAQEAIENAVHHARARKLSLQFSVAGADLSLTVADDGVGMDVEAVERSGQGSHFGLAGLRERAAHAGGQLTIRSRPGQGVCIQLVLKGAAAHAHPGM